MMANAIAMPINIATVPSGVPPFDPALQEEGSLVGRAAKSLIAFSVSHGVIIDLRTNSALSERSCLTRAAILILL